MATTAAISKNDGTGGYRKLRSGKWELLSTVQQQSVACDKMGRRGWTGGAVNVLVRNYRSCREAQDRQKSGIHGVYSA
jgi:hypothetical protein